MVGWSKGCAVSGEGDRGRGGEGEWWYVVRWSKGVKEEQWQHKGTEEGRGRGSGGKWYDGVKEEKWQSKGTEEGRERGGGGTGDEGGKREKWRNQGTEGGKGGEERW